MSPGAGRAVVRGISAASGLALAAVALSDPSWVGGAPGFGWTQGFLLGVGVALIAGCAAPFEWNARLLTLVLSTVLLVGLAEIVLDALYSPRYRGSSEYDDRTLYRLIPGAVREYRRQEVNGGDRIVYRVNSAGFRGEELDPDPELRIALYGDSFIQAEYSRLEDTLAERLELHLARRTGRRVEVVNAGVAGYGPDQILLKMEHELPLLEPDLVIAAIFAGNDFGDPLRNKLVRLGDDGQLVRNRFTLHPGFIREMEVRRNELISKQIVESTVFALAKRLGLRGDGPGLVESMTPRDRMDFFVEQHVREYEEYVVQGDDTIRDLAWDSYDADVSLLPRSDAARYKIALMDRIIGEMAALARSHAIPLLLLPIPHPVDVGAHEVAEVDPERYPQYRRRGLVDTLERIARTHGIPSVDLFAPFQEEGSDAVYFQGLDDHWNDHGQDVAARVVGEFLATRGLLRPPAAARPASSR